MHLDETEIHMLFGLTDETLNEKCSPAANARVQIRKKREKKTKWTTKFVCRCFHPSPFVCVFLMPPSCKAFFVRVHIFGLWLRFSPRFTNCCEQTKQHGTAIVATIKCEEKSEIVNDCCYDGDIEQSDSKQNNDKKKINNEITTTKKIWKKETLFLFFLCLFEHRRSILRWKEFCSTNESWASSTSRTTLLFSIFPKHIWRV